MEEPARPAQLSAAPVGGRLQRLRARLARSNSAFGQSLLGPAVPRRLDEEAWEDVEDDAPGLRPRRRAHRRSSSSRCAPRSRSTGTADADECARLLRADLLTSSTRAWTARSPRRRVDPRPAVILVVGVNGTGKTTTVGKLARVLVAEDRTSCSARPTPSAPPPPTSCRRGASGSASDRRSEAEGADPAAVAFDAVKRGPSSRPTSSIIDTAGRLHNKVG